MQGHKADGVQLNRLGRASGVTSISHKGRLLTEKISTAHLKDKFYVKQGGEFVDSILNCAIAFIQDL